MQVRAIVEFAYPKRSHTRLETPLGPLAFEEGLYYRLQQAGWIHPYRGVWTWTEPIFGG